MSIDANDLCLIFFLFIIYFKGKNILLKPKAIDNKLLNKKLINIDILFLGNN